MNQIEAEDLTYPDKPDANGYAKKYYKRIAYYFGTHNTPESFILFGEWKRRLLETGEPVKVKSIRIDLAHSRDLPANGPDQRQYIWPAALVTASMILGLAVVGAIKFVSTDAGATVDGVALTADEVNFVRGLRTHQGRMDALAKDHPERIAGLALQLKEEGPNGGKFHQTGNGS